MPHGQELSYAVRTKVVCRFFGQFCLVLAVLTLVPLLVALVSAEMKEALNFGGVILLLALTGGLLARLRTPADVQHNEAVVLAALVFLIPVLMAFPFGAGGLSSIDAIFEAVSGVTTTGLTTLSTVEDKSASFLFLRAWMQWYGGLGIMVLSLAVLIHPGMTAKRLAVTGYEENDIVGGTHARARRTLSVYLMLTAGGVILWILLGGKPWEGLLHILASVSTGGFAPNDNSLADLGLTRLAWLVSLVCLLGAIPLASFYEARRLDWRRLFRDIQVRGLLGAAIVSTVVLAFCLIVAEGMGLAQVLVDAPMMAFSAQTTSGFTSIPPAEMNAVSKGVLIVVMAVGGGAGSTAGGFKILRLLIFFALLRRILRKKNMPQHAVTETRLGSRALEDREVQDALMVILAFVAIIILSWLPFLAYGHDPLDALFEVVSATGTVGQSVGLCGPDLQAPLKLILCADMLLGRLEIIVWLLVFYPRTWIGRRKGEE
ncbi:MAG: potassium transporter TrkG [Desulfuromonadales bacterium]